MKTIQIVFRFLALFGVFLLLSFVSSCYYDNEEELYPEPAKPCDTTSVTYSTSVKPILDTKCAVAGCHNAQAQAAGINLSSHAGIQNYLEVSADRFISSIARDGNASEMPKGGNKLPECEITLIRTWVNAGFPNN
jgi:hypothetical protein